MAARADAQQAFLDGGDALAAELVSGDAALTAATEADGVWSLNTGDVSVGLVLDATAPTDAWGDATLAGWERPEVAEWVTTARNGIEHAMLVEAPLMPGNEQRLTVLTAGLQPILFNSSNVLLNDDNGLPVIAYGNLFAFDANAQEVPTWFEVVGSDIVIAFDDTDAAYPILIDPLATASSTNLGGVAHQVTSTTTGRGFFGWAVASGDINNDGYDDVVVSAPEACDTAAGCQVKEGIIKVFLGAVSGPATTATWTLDSDIANAYMGRSLAVADVDNDKCADIVAGAPFGEVGGETDEGVIVVFRSRYCTTGFSGFSPAIKLESNEADAYMGTSVAIAKTRSSGGTNGYIYATGGYSVGTSNTRAMWEFKFNLTTQTFSRTMRTFGTASAPLIPGVVVAVKDINGDGADEVAVSFPQAVKPASNFPYSPAIYGWVSVFRGLGNDGGISTTSLTLGCPRDAANNTPFCGAAMASADVNGDGKGDILVANYNGHVEVEAGYTSEKQLDVWLATANGIFPSSPSSRFGMGDPGIAPIFLPSHAVASLGDLNQDTYEDIAVCDGYSGPTGKCSIYSGRANGTLVYRGVYAGSGPAGAVTGENSTYEEFHHGMLAGGVTRKDPFPTGNKGSDIILGASFAGSNEGTVRVFNGTPAGPQFLVSSSQTFVKGSAVDQKVGRRVLLADLNNDGRDDLISGAPDATNGSLTEAGRVDVWLANSSGNFQALPSWSVNGTRAGERYGNALAVLQQGSSTTKRLAIGVPGACTETSGPTCLCLSCGAVEVHKWTGGIPDAVADDYIYRPAGEEGDQFGTSIANVGNIYGNTGGVDSLAVSTRDSAVPVLLFRFNTTTQVYDEEDGIADHCPGGSTLKEPFALAGVDMNNDGTTDVIVGDAGCSPTQGEGAVFGFAGGGLYTQTLFELTGTGKSRFGYALAAAGDVNRDGRPDLLVGAPSEHETGAAVSHAGAARVYLGTTSTPTLVQVVRGTVTDSRFGESVAGGRDVNFDGYVDFMVGAPNMSTTGGNGFVYRGTSTGAKLLTGCAEGDRAGLGLSVAMGDVNNDDYDDIACGAPTINGTPAGAGVVMVYRGMW